MPSADICKIFNNNCTMKTDNLNESLEFQDDYV